MIEQAVSEGPNTHAQGAAGPTDWIAFAQQPQRDDRGAASAGSTVRTVDLFSSVGGLTLGFELAASRLAIAACPGAAVDVDPGALAVHARNFGTAAVIRESVSLVVDYVPHGRGSGASFAYAPEVLHPELQSLTGRADVVLAGPPCQGHSNLNNHTRRDDPRNELYLTVPAVAVALGAPIVIIENVPEVTRDRSSVVQTAIALLEGDGYTIESGVIRAVDLGWPQTRRRYFLVATKGWRPRPLADVVAQERQPVGGVGDLIGDLIDREPNSFMDTTPELSPENSERIRLLFEEDLHDLPNHARPDCHKDGTTYGATYGRMHWDKPAPTITTGFSTPGRGRFVHPTRQRVLTPREAARIQGFPDWFTFDAADAPPTRADLAKWIGNAVPAPLGFVAGMSALLDSPFATATDSAT